MFGYTTFSRRIAAQRPQVRGGAFTGVGFAAGDDHAGPGEHVALGERQTDPPGATRDDHGASGHVEEFVERLAVHDGQYTMSAERPTVDAARKAQKMV